MERQGLADRVVRGLLELAPDQRVDRHPALGHLLLEHLEDGLELALVVGQQRHRVLLLVELDRGLGPLEVVPDGDLVLGLDDGVVHLGVVDLADDVEGMIIGHGRELRLRGIQSLATVPIVNSEPAKAGSCG